MILTQATGRKPGEARLASRDLIDGHRGMPALEQNDGAGRNGQRADSREWDTVAPLGSFMN